MAVRLNGPYPTQNTSGLLGRSFPSNFSPVTGPWVRNPSWPACEANFGDNKIVGLYAVYPGDGVGNGGNFFAVTISGDYTIDYGDGTVTNYTGGTTAYYEFNYTDADLAGTDAPVTFTASTDTVNRTAHGYTNGMTVRFYGIVSTTGINENVPYFVVNATANTFQVSATLGGSAIDLVNDGSAKLLPYKIATITITPQVGQNLTDVNFFVKHNQTNLQDGYSTGWLDLAIAGASITTLTIGSSLATVRHFNLERVRLNQLGNITSFINLFRNLRTLRSVSISDTITTVTSTNGMFVTCFSLTSVPLFDTSSVTDMTFMFNSCLSLKTVSPFNTASVINMGGMFANCSSLEAVPLLNTSSVTSMSSMFTSCVKLPSVPLFNTSLVTNMSSMFSGCFSLVSVPLFNTPLVTTTSSMFNNCYSLVSVPLFNTASVTQMNLMFNGCVSLESVPLFNTASAINMTSMFAGCSTLKSVPLFNTSSVTNMSFMFQNCGSLKTVPQFNTASVTDMSVMFNNCSSLESVPLFNTASVTQMPNMFNGCSKLTSIPLFNTSAVTGIGGMFNGCNTLTSVPALVTTAVTSSGNFGSMFTGCPSLARIQAKNFRFSFSVANCKLSSTALNEIYTNLPTVTGQTITVSGNYGTAGDDPTIATAKGWTVTG